MKLLRFGALIPHPTISHDLEGRPLSIYKGSTTQSGAYKVTVRQSTLGPDIFVAEFEGAGLGYLSNRHIRLNANDQFVGSRGQIRPHSLIEDPELVADGRQAIAEHREMATSGLHALKQGDRLAEAVELITRLTGLGIPIDRITEAVAGNERRDVIGALKDLLPKDPA